MKLNTVCAGPARRAQHRGEIVEDPKPRVDVPRGAIIMKQDTSGDEAVADFPAEENRAYGKREDIEVDKRDRNNDMICICYGGNRPQDQNDWQPTPSVRSHLLRS